MFKVYRKEMEWGGKKLTLETGKIARQADGAVLATLGGTTVLCTVVAAKKAKPGQGFFPLLEGTAPQPRSVHECCFPDVLGSGAAASFGVRAPAH